MTIDDGIWIVENIELKERFVVEILSYRLVGIEHREVFFIGNDSMSTLSDFLRKNNFIRKINLEENIEVEKIKRAIYLYNEWGEESARCKFLEVLRVMTK